MIYIGIDPDVDKSGVAKYNTETKKIEGIELLSFFDLLDFLKYYRSTSVKVIIEGGHLNKVANFHNRPGQTKKVGETIAKSVGRNHQTGILIGEMCSYLDIDFEFCRPAEKKFSSSVFRMMTGIEVKNQEKIDAAMLVYGRK